MKVAAPAILSAEDWGFLDEAEARLKAVATYIEAFSGDRLEFEKALRVVEKRRGDLLLGGTTRGTDDSKQTATRWRTLARNWDKLWPLIIAAESVREISQAELLRCVNGTVHFSSDSPEWSTPQELFDALDAEFRFVLDVCATSENAKCQRYFTAETDGLSQRWSGVCWMNPPYGAEIGKWVQKAWEAAEAGATVVCLVPARIDTRWFWDYCRYGEVRVLPGRLKFGGGENSAPFPSAVVIFGRPQAWVWWEWPKV